MMTVRSRGRARWAGRVLGLVLLIDGGLSSVASAPPEQKQSVSSSPTQYVFTVKFSDDVRTAKVSTSGLQWSCKGRVCTAKSSKAKPALATCTSVAKKIGTRIVEFQRSGKKLSQKNLGQCNETLLAGVSKQNASAAKPKDSAKSNSTAMSVQEATRRAAPKTLTSDFPDRAIPKQPPLPADFAQRLKRYSQLERERELRMTSAQAKKLTERTTAGLIRYGGDDCNDRNSEVYRGATEICDGLDNNCNGFVDENQTILAYVDADGDLHGDPSRRTEVCPADLRRAQERGRWLVTVGNDCDDSDPSRWRDCD